jgi:hypothetical protein
LDDDESEAVLTALAELSVDAAVEPVVAVLTLVPLDVVSDAAELEPAVKETTSATKIFVVE